MFMKDLSKTKVVVMDIDGTLCEVDHILTDETYKALVDMQEKGIFLGLASGRSVYDIGTYYKEWNLPREFDFYIGMNGAMLYESDTKKLHEGYLMTFEEVCEILDHMAPLNMSASMYCDDDVNYISGVNELVEASIKRNIGKSKFKIIDDINEIKDRKTYRVLFRVDEGRMDEIKEYVKNHLKYMPRWKEDQLSKCKIVNGYFFMISYSDIINY